MTLNQVLLLNTYFLYSASIINFILGLIVYLRRRRNIVNLTFTLLAFDLGFWSLSIAILYTFPSLFWMNNVLAFFGWSLITTFLLFARNFPTPSKKPLFLFYFSLAFWQIFITVGCLLPGWFFERIFIENGLPQVEFGLGYTITSLVSFPYIIYFFYLLYAKYKKATGTGKMQMKYLFLGLITFTSIAVFSVLFW